MQFAEKIDVVIEVYSSEFLEYIRADEVGAVREFIYLHSRGGLIGSEVVIIFDVGELVDGAGIRVCDVFKR